MAGMIKRTQFLVALLALSLTIGGLPAKAQPVEPVLLAVPVGRTQGIFSKRDVEIRAAVLRAAQPTGKAILIFRGWPGIANLEQASDAWRSLNFMRAHLGQFLDHGISVVIVDCPTDQRALRDRANPLSCDDNYRSSTQHAEDVRRLIDHLRGVYGIDEPYIFGHSYGTLSSKWLALNLGNAIAGSIHSASQTRAGGGAYTQFGYTALRVEFAKISTPVLHVHHGQDQCPYTPYATVVGYSSGNNLITVRGGLTNGDPCGGTHHHSYEGRELVATQVIARWILTRETSQYAGDD
jgi:pimeloyl-ACP methyl ester carboxylesterase